jgi:hypothetical protein
VRDKTKHVYGTFFAAKTSVVAFGARMAFVRESLRRLSAKQDRRRHRQKTTGTKTKIGKGEVDGDWPSQAWNILSNCK